MKNKNPQIKVESFGRYTRWEKGSRDLPKILEFTNTIEALEGNEFGMILKIIGGRGIRLNFCIKHPPFLNESGDIEPDFTGEYRINSNHYEFYIGDCIVPPAEEKIGTWEVIVYFRGREIATEKFEIVPSKNNKENESY